MKRFVFGFVATVILASSTNAASIGLFMDPVYVDTGSEGANLQNALIGLGHGVNNFVGVSVTDWTTAMTNNDLIVIAELETNNLFNDLPSATQTEIANYVSGGGKIITIDSTDPNFDEQTVDLLNGLFGFSLVGVNGFAGGGPVSMLNAGDAAGTAFQGGPALLPGANKVDAVLTSSLPSGALDLYNDGELGTTVFCAPVGTGEVIHLGFDWFESPAPGVWNTVLDTAVDHGCSITVIPEPSTITLGLFAMLSVFGAYRRKRS